ncbi:MAG: long-chain fatty acid--CoA ligase, partial [Pseudomonadota bacterium]|nr:long-chain fatty acid--CoA ligase [Pseudomonadota bacterium]
GYVRIAGRVKEMIIRGGENIYPKEIENSLLEHNDISEVAIVGLPDEKFGEIVGCFLKFEKGQKLTSTDLKAFIRKKISPQKTPAVWIEIDEWPLTGSGKIKKYALREQLSDGLLNVLT